jgi:hypothetical protein
VTTIPLLTRDEEKNLRDAEFLVIETRGTNISFYNIIDGLPPIFREEIDKKGEAFIMGSDNSKLIVRPPLLLAGDFRTRESEDVIEFGQALIAYASLTDRTVGPPVNYGVDAILIHRQHHGFLFEERMLTSKYGMEWRFGYRWQE